MKIFAKKVLKIFPGTDNIRVGFIALFFLYMLEVEVAIYIISLLYIF
jgi:hypothetical protein